MPLKRLLMTAVVAVTILTASALAQQNELTGIIGRTFISDQGVKGAVNLISNNVHFGNGCRSRLTTGVTSWAMGSRLTFEVPAVFDLDQDVNFAVNSVPSSYSSYFVTPSLRANVFATTAISPWVSFGGGIGHFNPSSQLEFGGPNPNKGSTTGIFQMCLGLDVRIKRTISLRGEVRTSGPARRTWVSTPARAVSTTFLSVAA
jgi:hypothetical protein